MSHLEHVGGDRWKVRVYAGRDPEGKERQRTRSFRAKNRTEAKRMASAITTKLQDSVDEERARADTIAGLADEWLALCRRTLSPSTMASYEARAKVIVERFGKIRVDALTPRQVDRWYGELLETTSARTGELLSPAEVSAYHRVLRAMLNQAVIWEMTDKTVAKAVRPPKVVRAAHKLPTTAALSAVIEAAPVSVRTALHLSAATGARRGEVVGLRWDDFTDEGVWIRRSLLDVKGHRGKAKTTKTGPARFVTLDAGTLAAVAGWREVHAAKCAQYEDDLEPSPWLFPNWRNGTRDPCRPGWLSHAWTELRDKHGIDANLHALRHWHASTLIAQGIPVIEASKRLGHSKVSTTLDIYGHMVPGERGRSADVIAGELGRG